VLRILFWILALPLFILVVVFAASNPAKVSLDLWPFAQVDLPLYSVGLIGGLIGLILGVMIAWAQGASSRGRMRHLLRDLEAQKRELLSLREKVASLEAAEQQATIPARPLTAA
jgi:uncharacterized integral membrane protein